MKYPLVKISEVSTLKTGATPSKTRHEYFGGAIKWLVSGDIHQQEIFDCEGRITEAGMKNSNAKLLPADSVLIALNGQGKTKGTVAILRVEATCNQSLIAMIPNKNLLTPEYLYHNLKSRYQEIRNLAGGDKRRGLNMKIVGSIQIPLPPVSVQKSIVAKLDTLLKTANEIKKIQEKTQKDLESLERIILARAFTGESEAKNVESKLERTREDWFAIKQGIGAILEKLSQTPFERGEMVIAKYMFFLQEVFKVPFGLNFVRHQFGPYDPDIRRAITASAFNKDRYFKVKGSGEAQVYSLGDNAAKLFKYGSHILADSRNALGKLIQHTGNAKSVDIERLATVCKIVQDIKSTELESVMTEIKGWKKNKFSEEEVSRSLQFIKSENWDKALITK